MSKRSSLFVGALSSFDKVRRGWLHMPSHHLITHGVVLGMTGSGKTGLVTVIVEEALRDQVPVLIIDVKGDLPNLLLSFPDNAADSLLPWLESPAPDDQRSALERARALAEQRRLGMSYWNLSESDVRDYWHSTDIRVITPGSSAGEMLHVLSSLERRTDRWEVDAEGARAALSAAVSLLLRLVGRDSDPVKSREHVFLYTLAERRLVGGGPASLELLVSDLQSPPISTIGPLTVDSFLAKSERMALAAALSAVLVSPSFASWRQGTALDIQEWMTPKHGRTPAVVISVAHLDDEERALVLGVLLEEVLTWVRGLPGSQRLRALLVFDELYGFLPPHPRNPPTKRPLVALMKQARAFGVGVLLATQNPMDLDYRALGNAGLWCVGHLQTEADCARVVDGLSGAVGELGMSKTALAKVIKGLKNRWFVMRDGNSKDGVMLMQPRFAMSLLRGPMTRVEVRRAREERARGWGREAEAAE